MVLTLFLPILHFQVLSLLLTLSTVLSKQKYKSAISIGFIKYCNAPTLYPCRAYLKNPVIKTISTSLFLSLIMLDSSTPEILLNFMSKNIMSYLL